MINQAAQRVVDDPAALQGLLDQLPHRPPFHFLTRIQSLDSGVSGHAQWHVGGDEEFFRGHFPGDPIVPGVLIIEALAQLAGLVGLHDIENPTAERTSHRCRLAHADVRFDGSVRPPAVIDLHATLQRSIGQLHLFEVRAVMAGSPVARGVLTLGLTGADQSRQAVNP